MGDYYLYFFVTILTLSALWLVGLIYRWLMRNLIDKMVMRSSKYTTLNCSVELDSLNPKFIKDGVNEEPSLDIMFSRMIRPEVTKQQIKEISWRSQAQSELQRLEEGRIVFNPPERMKVGVSKRVEARIGLGDVPYLADNLKGEGEVQEESVSVSRLMEVTLTGTNFNITTLSKSEPHLIPDDDYAEWSWNVTPTVSGDELLHLQVTAIVYVASEKAYRPLPVIDKEIVVQVNRPLAMKKFWGKYWKWVTTTALIPVGVYLFKNWTAIEKLMESPPG